MSSTWTRASSWIVTLTCSKGSETVDSRLGVRTLEAHPPVTILPSSHASRDFLLHLVSTRPRLIDMRSAGIGNVLEVHKCILQAVEMPVEQRDVPD